MTLEEAVDQMQEAWPDCWIAVGLDMYSGSAPGMTHCRSLYSVQAQPLDGGQCRYIKTNGTDLEQMVQRAVEAGHKRTRDIEAAKSDGLTLADVPVEMCVEDSK